MTPTELIKIRRSLNLTQEKLGAEIKLNKKMVSLMEKGRKPILKTTELAINWLAFKDKQNWTIEKGDENG